MPHTWSGTEGEGQQGGTLTLVNFACIDVNTLPPRNHPWMVDDAVLQRPRPLACIVVAEGKGEEAMEQRQSCLAVGFREPLVVLKSPSSGLFT